MSTVPNLLKIGLVANIFEWYEFTIYVYLIDIISQLFFNVSDPVSGAIQAFSIFAIGYLARPLGSLFFGYIGDRKGAGHSLKIVLLTMAVPTALIGMLPTYQAIGLAAPILLAILRLVQGFSMGGELPVSVTYIFEASHAHYKSQLCSIVTASSVLGTLLASLIAFLLFHYFGRQTILAWAWRIPFLFSACMTVGIAIIRRNISDLPLQQAQSLRSTSQALKISLLRPALLFSLVTTFSYILAFWMPFYLTHILDYPSKSAQLTNVLILLALIPLYLAIGTLSRFLGYKRIIIFGIISIILFISPLFFGLQQASFRNILTMQLLMALIFSSVAGVVMEALARQFPDFVRCRGVNLAYTLPATFLGGTTPLVCTWVIEKTGFIMFPAFYIMFFGLLALPAACKLKNAQD